MVRKLRTTTVIDNRMYNIETPIATERRSTTVRLPSGTTRKAKRNATKNSGTVRFPEFSYC